MQPHGMVVIDHFAQRRNVMVFRLLHIFEILRRHLQGEQRAAFHIIALILCRLVGAVFAEILAQKVIAGDPFDVRHQFRIERTALPFGRKLVSVDDAEVYLLFRRHLRNGIIRFGRQFIARADHELAGIALFSHPFDLGDRPGGIVQGIRIIIETEPVQKPAGIQ